MKAAATKHVRVVDRPCGYGKTTQLLKSFRPERRYLVVVPTLDEVERIIDGASVPFVQPELDRQHRTKRDSLETLLHQGCNIATTHALYMDVAMVARNGLLDEYDIIIDEVLDVCAQVEGASPRSFDQFYIRCGYATVDLDGQVHPTPKWEAEIDAVSDTLKERLFRLAKAGMLYYVDGTFFMWALPRELLSSGRSFTVYTYMAEGSMFLAYLKKLGIPWHHDRDPEVDAAFRLRAQQLIEVRRIERLGRTNLSFTGQTNNPALAKQVSSALRGLRRGPLRDVPLGDVLVTCKKDKWFDKGEDDPEKRRAGPYARGSKMFEGVHWIANTTRGTNNYAHTSHLIYLYDQNMNPFIRRWLGLGGDPEAQDRYALSELIQWVYRSRVRRGESIVLFLPSNRMRRLFQGWLEGLPSSSPEFTEPLALAA